MLGTDTSFPIAIGPSILTVHFLMASLMVPLQLDTLFLTQTPPQPLPISALQGQGTSQYAPANLHLQVGTLTKADPYQENWSPGCMSEQFP